MKMVLLSLLVLFLLLMMAKPDSTWSHGKERHESDATANSERQDRGFSSFTIVSGDKKGYYTAISLSLIVGIAFIVLNLTMRKGRYR